MLLWWEGYVKTYLERDLRELSQIENLVDFRRLLSVLALRSGSVLNRSALARDIGISQPTVYRYIKLLEVSNLLMRVPPLTASRNKRVVKSPKLYYIDPGLNAFLAGYHDTDSLRSARELGSLFECLVHLQLRADAELQVPRVGIHFWRTSGGQGWISFWSKVSSSSTVGPRFWPLASIKHQVDELRLPKRTRN